MIGCLTEATVAKPLVKVNSLGFHLGWCFNEVKEIELNKLFGLQPQEKIIS